MGEYYGQHREAKSPRCNPYRPRARSQKLVGHQEMGQSLTIECILEKKTMFVLTRHRSRNKEVDCYCGEGVEVRIRGGGGDS